VAHQLSDARKVQNMMYTMLDAYEVGKKYLKADRIRRRGDVFLTEGRSAERTW
jgi:hypothetical protein